jgi:prepilin-type N-terminal cleavage/methylation domain-containing protein
LEAVVNRPAATHASSPARPSAGGYTIIELIIAMTIFAIIIVITVGSFVSVSNLSSKTSAQRGVQQDARYNLEEIARQSRASSIDYKFYSVNASTPCSISTKNVLTEIYTEAGANNTPVQKRLIFFYVAGVPGALYKYEDPNTDFSQVPTCATVLATVANGSATRLTGDNFDVKSAFFLITPDSDPYDTTSAVPKPANYYHPRVTIQMTIATRTNPVNVRSQSQTGSVTIETTVSSRAYPASKLSMLDPFTTGRSEELA